MDLIEDLIKKREDLFKQVEAIDTVLRIYGYAGSDYKVNEISSNNVNVSKGVFPTKARVDKQLLWLFENFLKKGLKLKEVQEKFNELLGNDGTNIDNYARKLKKAGKLVIVKYNDKHLHSYWGHPDWIDGNDFKQEYKPDFEFLPEIISSEVIRE